MKKISINKTHITSVAGSWLETTPQKEKIAPARTLFTDLLESVGIETKAVSAFTGVTLEHAQQWRTGARKMPFYIALSLVWLAKHILAKQEASNTSLLIVTVGASDKDLIERSRKLLALMTEQVSWWSQDEFDKAKAYCAQRGGQFDLVKEGAS